jgi:rod shape determining protein RodA
MAVREVAGEAVDRIGGEPVSARMARRAPVRHLDPTLLLVTVLLTIYGAVMIYSATEADQLAAGLDPGLYLKRQIAYAVVASGALVLAGLFDYRYLRAFAPLFYLGALLGLVLVLTPLGVSTAGASRWFDVGSFRVQPSELAKIAVIVSLAAYLAERKGEVRLRDIAVCCALVLGPMVLIYLEPDLGTMMVFAALTGALFLVGGAKIRHFLLLGCLAVAAVLTVLHMGLLEDYQLQRITTFLDPNPDVQSEGYNQYQAEIAIASGGINGKGIQQENTQTSLDFIPEQHTDFIFTAVGEQLGFVGSAVLLGLFAFLIWRALRIAAMSRDLFGALLAGGIAVLWAFQIFVNVGMTMGVMPITGIPLPFVSFGGSSLLTNFACVGILHNIHMRRFL